MQIDVTHDIVALNEHLTELQQRLNGDLTPLMIKIGGTLEGSTRERFNTKTAPSGVSWADLMPSTQKQKGNNNILVNLGILQESIRYEAHSDYVQIGSNHDYAKYPQVGTKNMVARPFLGISQEDKREIQDEINDFLAGLINP